jgi:hypothetical protein
VNGLEPTALLNQELDLMPTGENKSRFIRRRSIIRLPDKKCGSLMQVSVLFIVFARIGDDKILLVSSMMLTTEFQWVKKNTN